METVVAFNTELSGLYESKPPISKAKMTSITRSAMKAIKFYKHVVQSVEKFILKCKQEYKIPGLYVIDSIVRQSRHQFGTEKDVFAPRFARNMQTTFANLFQCSPEDKSKIIRVLNLWQKNNVFAPDVIQPLFDLADPNHPIYQNQGVSQDSSINGMMSSINQESPAQNMTDEGHTMSSDMSGPINSVNHIDPATLRHLQILMRQKNNEPVAGTSSNSAQDSVKFNKKLLDFDYGDDEDDDNKGSSPRQSQQQMQNAAIDNNNLTQLLNDPNVLRQLHNLQKLKQMEEKQSKLAEMRMKEEAFEKHLATMLKKLPFANECDLSRQDNPIYGMQNTNLNTNQNGPMYSTANTVDKDPDIELVSDDGKVEVINLDGNSRSPSIDRDRYSKRRRSRSRSRGRRRRSRSRSRGRRSSRDRGLEDKNKRKIKEREKDRDRKRKGLPEIKRDHLSVCSTTLWIGHLSKLTQQEELSDIFTKYGDIVSIDMIHPRGCAFLVMHRRQDAYKAIDALNGYKLHGRVISISWAAGKGVKSKEWKDYWDLELGVSYIPWEKLDENTDFEQLEDGGMFDEDTMPQWMKDKLKNQSQKKDSNDANANVNTMANMVFGMDTTQPPPAAQMIPNMAPPFAIGPRFMPPIMGVPPAVPPMMIPPPYFFPPMMPTQTIPSTAPNTNTNTNTTNNDDQMDIEEDESNDFFQRTQNSNSDPMFQKTPNMFNRPPPKLFTQNPMPPTPNDINSNNSGIVDDFRGRALERDNRSRTNRENRRDYSNERGNRNPNTRWSEGCRGRSRENDRTSRNDRRDNDGAKPLPDRCAVQPEGNNRDFNGPRSNMHFSNSYVDQQGAPPRPMNMSAGPPALEDMRIAAPIDNLRGMPIGPINNNKPHHGRRQMPPNGPRDFYNQRFGPPGMNGVPMNMMRGTMQQFGRNNNPMFMWQPRPGMNNNDRPEGNFNRNDRHRVNMNQRGPRHWKDNDDGAPLTKRNNRNFDGSKDNRNSYSNLNDKQSKNDEEAYDVDDGAGNPENRLIEMIDSTTQGTASSDNKSFPRIQIKSPSKLSQDFNEKQADDATISSAMYDSNRTNNNKTSVDLNTTPLYDEPAEDRSYSAKTNPNNTSVSHQSDTENNVSLSPCLASSQMQSTNVETTVSTMESNDINNQ